MSRTRNEALAAWMAEHKVTALELAERVNDAIGKLTGKRGLVSERTVFRWLSGEASWPQARQRVALEAVTGRAATQLGFTPRGRLSSTTAGPEAEDPVRRRSFITAATGSALGVAAAGAAPPRQIGYAEVDRFNALSARVVAADEHSGGTRKAEAQAARYAQQALELQQSGSASQRVRSQLYSVAAELTASAMWAATDGCRFDAAQQHLNRAVILAGLSGEPVAQFAAWEQVGQLYSHTGRYTDAIAAVQAAAVGKAATRDPLFASLMHARRAAIEGALGETTAVLRSLDKAQTLLGRADPSVPRPVWMGFYDQAELELLALIAKNRLGMYEEAEAHAHRHLALLRPHLRRNRALACAHLARAQLAQGELECAVASARTIPADTIHGRTAGLLDGFTQQLTATAPDTAPVREWTEYTRNHRRTSV